MNFLAFFIRYDHNDAITETESLSLFALFHWLVFFFFPLRSFDNDVRRIMESFEKPRRGSLAPFYIEVRGLLQLEADQEI